MTTKDEPNNFKYLKLIFERRDFNDGFKRFCRRYNKKQKVYSRSNIAAKDVPLSIVDK